LFTRNRRSAKQSKVVGNATEGRESGYPRKSEELNAPTI
jgi:hypothetical protein